MSNPASSIRRLEAADLASGFRCGKRPLDDFFARHALPNDRANIGRTYVRPRRADEPSKLPTILGFYTLSMADVEAAIIGAALDFQPPRYRMPVALIGRLAVDERARGRRIGEELLVNALQRIQEASGIVACLGVVVDAKDDDAERFYTLYGLVTLEPSGAWPRRMFLSLQRISGAFRS